MGQTYQREAAIFDAAMELPPEQRAAHIDPACAGDAALRQRMEALLEAAESSSGFLNSAADPVTVGPANALQLAFEKAATGLAATGCFSRDFDNKLACSALGGGANLGWQRVSVFEV